MMRAKLTKIKDMIQGFYTTSFLLSNKFKLDTIYTSTRIGISIP